MGRHLKVDKWFHKMPSGKLKRKRVSSSLAKQFPIELRVIYQKHGVCSLVDYLRKADNSTLIAAWSKVKMMFNGS